MFVENPLLEPAMWPIDFDSSRRGQWSEITFAELEQNEVIGFPKIDTTLINPVAIDIISGPHALKKADATLTYMQQLMIKDLDLPRQDAVNRLQMFPGDWPIQFLEIKTPDDFQPSPANPRQV